MEGAIDLRLIITLGGILFSVAGAAAVGKMQIKVILEAVADMEWIDASTHSTQAPKNKSNGSTYWPRCRHQKTYVETT